MDHSTKTSSRLRAPSWKSSFLLSSPKQQHRLRSNSAEDSPVSTMDIYPTVQELHDDSAAPSMPDISAPRKLQTRSRSVGTLRRFRDDYVMTRPMFRTAHCCIWECVHRRSGHRYCVKVLKDDANFEVETLMAVQYHPNICRYHESIQETDNKTFLVMELYDGGNLLSHIVQNGVMDEDAAMILIRQILNGLLHLHETKQMVHGNISPDNILLHSDCHAVLSDFGRSNISSKYTAPERQSSFASDMYSVGAVLHSMLMGDTVALIETRALSRLCKQFLILLLHADPDVRPTVREALRHEFLAEGEKILVERPPRNFVRKLLRRRKLGSSSAGSTASSCQS